MEVSSLVSWVDDGCLVAYVNRKKAGMGQPSNLDASLHNRVQFILHRLAFKRDSQRKRQKCCGKAVQASVPHRLCGVY